MPSQFDHDKHFGANGHPFIEPNFYSVNGSPKRFFDEASLDLLIRTGWDTVSKQPLTTRKHFATKEVWEIVLRRKEE